MRDLNWTSQVRIASVDIPFDLAGSTAEVRLLDAEMERRNRDGVTQKITAVLVTNPHNPLGFCYPKEVLLVYCRFAERWNLFLVVDEVYATSVYDSRAYRTLHLLVLHGPADCLYPQPTCRTRPPLRAYSRSMSARMRDATRLAS